MQEGVFLFRAQITKSASIIIYTNNPDFYPTPKALIDQILSGIDIAGKVVLEPSAGDNIAIEPYIPDAGHTTVTYMRTRDDGTSEKAVAVLDKEKRYKVELAVKNPKR